MTKAISLNGEVDYKYRGRQQFVSWLSGSLGIDRSRGVSAMLVAVTHCYGYFHYLYFYIYYFYYFILFQVPIPLLLDRNPSKFYGYANQPAELFPPQDF